MSRSRIIKAIPLVTLLSAFIAIIVPLQTYLGNKEAFLFSACELLLECALLFAAIFIALCLLLILLGRKGGNILHLMCLAIIIGLYLETGILSFGLPSLNGTATFSNVVVKGYDSLAWALVIVAVAIFHKFFLKWSNWVVLIIAVMSLASLFDAKKKTESVSPMQENRLAKDFYPAYDIVKNVRYSPTSNVLIFILDSCPATLSTTIMEENIWLTGWLIDGPCRL